MHLHHHDIDPLEHDIQAQEQALAVLLEKVMQVPLAPLRSTLDALRERVDAVEQVNATALRQTELLLGSEIGECTRKLGSRVGAIDAKALALQDGLEDLLGALERHEAGSGERAERLAAIHAHSHALLAAFDVKWRADAAAMGQRLDGLAEAIMMQREHDRREAVLRAGQHAELARHIEAVPAALAPRFVDLDAALATATRELAQRCTALEEAHQLTVARTVEQLLALQLAPLRKRNTWLLLLCGACLACSAALLALLVAR